MESYIKQTIHSNEANRQILQLPDKQEVTLTFARTGGKALKTAKEILIQHSVKKLMNKGLI